MNKIFYILVLMININLLSAKEMQKIVWPSAPDEPRVEYVSSIKNSKDLDIKKGFFTKIFNFVFGDDEKSLSAPFGLHTDKNRIYITDVVNKTVHVYDKKDNETILIEGSDNELFLYPIDVVSDNYGNIYVSDSMNSKIFVFEEDGDFSHTIRPPTLQRPVGIAISVDNKKLYIVDAVSSQIHVTSLKGKFLYSIGKRGFGNGEFNRPTFIDIGSDGKLYVTDSMNHRVQILESDGKFIRKFGQVGQDIGSFGSPKGISVDNNDNIYVSDTMFNVIQVFNQQGELLLVFGNLGNGKGEFGLVEDLSITHDNMLLVADTNNKRVQLFKLLNPPGRGNIK